MFDRLLVQKDIHDPIQIAKFTDYLGANSHAQLHYQTTISV